MGMKVEMNMETWKGTLERIGRDKEWIETIERCATPEWIKTIEGGNDENQSGDQLASR